MDGRLLACAQCQFAKDACCTPQREARRWGINRPCRRERGISERGVVSFNLSKIRIGKMTVRTDANAIAKRNTPRIQRLRQRRQRGVTLVELSVAVAVMGLIMAGAMVGVPRLMNSVKLSQEMKDWQMSALAVQNGVASGILTTQSTPEKILEMAVAEPFNRTNGGKSLLNRFGGNITINPVPGTTYPSSGVMVKSVGYPSAQCEEFAAKMIGTFATLSINGAEIKKGDAVDKTKIVDACKSNGGSDVTQADLDFTIAG
ncbi:prepilin-type N-terminal cleavage/methylation domain-containing protein [Pandoraea pnomenusa]|nr:prepilin-type N-terminal cleavage/methylation domain-containing protein [Pandoraea pnomenusa]